MLSNIRTHTFIHIHSFFKSFSYFDQMQRKSSKKLTVSVFHGFLKSKRLRWTP